jgi:hypothetical protein
VTAAVGRADSQSWYSLLVILALDLGLPTQQLVLLFQEIKSLHPRCNFVACGRKRNAQE